MQGMGMLRVWWDGAVRPGWCDVDTFAAAAYVLLQIRKREKTHACWPMAFGAHDGSTMLDVAILILVPSPGPQW